MLGELGWDKRRWQESTFPEVNLAIAGYWNNWERNTAWLLREIKFELISGNPYINESDKPKKSSELMSLKDDNLIKQKEEKQKIIISPGEVEKIKNKLFEKLNKKP